MTDRLLLLPSGSTYFSLSTCYSPEGNPMAFRANAWVTPCDAFLPCGGWYQCPDGMVNIQYFATEEELRECVNPAPKKEVKKHRLAKALILSVAALSGMLDDNIMMN